jgi:hypothetical protein
VATGRPVVDYLFEPRSRGWRQQRPQAHFELAAQEPQKAVGDYAKTWEALVSAFEARRAAALGVARARLTEIAGS